jgi:transcriptional regulator GlxA family with amidase domain
MPRLFRRHRPRAKPRRVTVVVYSGIQILDATGPAAVFSAANRDMAEPAYEVELVSSRGGAIASSAGISIETRATRDCDPRTVHTLLVAGGDEHAVQSAMADRTLERWVTHASEASVRYGSVCSGAFVLAAYGLLDGYNVATHWQGCTRLAKLFPKLSVDPEALYVVQGRVWTSAGVTTGIDMALAMVEKDLGAAAAAAVAQALVVYSRRPGYQSQFSPVLRAQLRSDSPYAGLIDWLQTHLHESLAVDDLARRARQSARDFHRKFVAVTGQTPARFVENLRLDQVRMLLPHALSLKEIADQTGFGSAVRMSRAFERRFGVKPSLFREMLPVE